MKKKRLKQFASVVLTLTLAVQPVIAGAQELDVSAENFDSAEVFADTKEEETESAATETETTAKRKIWKLRENSQIWKIRRVKWKR